MRAVVAGQGIKGGPLFDTTKAWFNFLRLIVAAMKRGYAVTAPATPDSSDAENGANSDDDGADEASTASSSNAGKNDAKNLFIMKRRNAFWKIEHRDSIASATATSTSTSMSMSTAAAPTLFAHASPDSVFHSPRISSSRKFSVQF